MKKRYLFSVLLIIIASLLVFVSCGAESNYAVPEGGDSAGAIAGSGTLPDDRKVIREYYITLETQEFNDTVAKLRAAVLAVEGYEENATVNPTTAYRKGHARMQFRIPTDKIDAFNASINGIGVVVSQQVTSRDVTLSYEDINARIKSLQGEYDRVYELLQNASQSTVLEISKRLQQIEADLTSYRNQLAAMDKRIDYTSYTFTISDVVEYTEDRNFFERVWYAMGDSFKIFLEVAEWFLMAFIYLFPYGAAMLLIVVITLLPAAIVLPIVFRKRIRARRAARRAKCAAAKAEVSQE